MEKFIPIQLEPTPPPIYPVDYGDIPDSWMKDYLCSTGIQKDFRIVFKPSAGNTIYFLNGRFEVIRDLRMLYFSDVIIATNQPPPGYGQPLFGFDLHREAVQIRGVPREMTKFYVHSPESKIIIRFEDEFSFWKWMYRSPISSIENVEFN